MGELAFISLLIGGGAYFIAYAVARRFVRQRAGILLAGIVAVGGLALMGGDGMLPGGIAAALAVLHLLTSQRPVDD